MKQKTFIIVVSIVLIFAVFSCRQNENKTENQSQNISLMPRAEQINITDLKSVLKRLQSRQLEFDFFGIHSRGVDCIYFIPDSSLFNIEFEAMDEDQLPFIDKLKDFATKNGYTTKMLTYGNEPHYKTSDTAPVLRIETKSDLDQTAIIGQNIMSHVFGNNDQTLYEVVP